MNAILIVFILFAYGTFAFPSYNIKTDFGAKGDGSSDDTKLIRNAMSSCQQQGGCAVYFPSGTYRSSHFTLSSNVHLSFASDAGILFLDDWENWDISGGDYVNLIGVSSSSNISISGGFLDGNGERWWDAFRDGKLKAGRPLLLVMDSCRDILLESVTLRNSPCFHFKPYRCTNVEVSHCTIRAPFFHSSVNTDGIDPSSSSNVYIHDCDISTGDDNVAIKGSSSNILVENCVFGTGHGASIGSLSDGDTVSNITFRGIKMTNTVNGARLKTKSGWSGSAEYLNWQHIQMENVQNPILVTMYYSMEEGEKTKLEPNPTGKIWNLQFDQIHATGAKVAGTFECRGSGPCHDIQMQDVDIKADEGFSCKDAYGKTNNVHPEPCLK